MIVKRFLQFLWRVIASSLAFALGMVFGGMAAAAAGLQPPPMPEELDVTGVTTMLLATSPLLVLALYFLNRELAGGWLGRGAILFLISWIAYSVNNVIEAAVFTSYETASLFTLVNFVPALLLCAFTTAWLFHTNANNISVTAAWRAFFQRHAKSSWVWRLLLAAVIFMPIYYLFGLLVVPFVGEYYQQGNAGLTVPPLGTLLAVLFVRSLLFLIACLPVAAAWQGGRASLVWSLGFALFVLVGLLYMLAGSWIAPHIRIVHSLEILADSIVYAWALVWILTWPGNGYAHHPPAHPPAMEAA